MSGATLLRLSPVAPDANAEPGADASPAASAQGGAGEPAKLSLRSLAEILSDPEAMRAPEPVVPRLAWAGRVTLLAGREKLGKSTLASAGAAAASSGSSFLGEPCKAGSVLWVGLEEHPGDTAARFMGFGADPTRVYLLDRLERPLFDVGAAIQQTSAVLVVVDTLAAFAETLVDDPGSSTKWTPVMAGLTRLARDSGAAFILLHHARKSDGAYRDSTAIGAGVDAVLEMHPADEDTARKLKGKGRWSIEDCTLRLDGERYELAAGELGLDARVLLFVERNPGCSVRKLREGVQGKNEAKDAAIARLLERGAMVDRGDASGRRFYSGTGAHPGARPQTTTVPPENVEGTRGGTLWGHAEDSGCAPCPNPKESIGGTRSDVPEEEVRL